VGVDIEYLPPICRIHRAWRYREFGRTVHVVPPEQLGGDKIWSFCSDGFPELVSADEMVGLFPELHLREVPVIPAIAYDSVFRRRLTCQIGRLHRTGDRWHLWLNIDAAVPHEKFLDIRRVLADTSAAEPYHIDHRRPFHFVSRVRPATLLPQPE
jgi:hypothetical protein